MNNLKTSLIIALVLLGMLNDRLGAQVITGSTKLEKVSHESLTIAGSLNFNNLTIEQILSVSGSAEGDFLKCEKFIINGSFAGKNIQATNGEVSGSLTCEKTNIDNDLEVNGSLKATETKVSGKTKVDGNLDASRSSFSDIEISSWQCTLRNSKAKNIFIKKTKDKSQRIYLKGKTIIEGNITFESGNGKVIFSNEAKVKGKVQGASVVNGFNRIGGN